jgi:hypothetical protein
MRTALYVRVSTQRPSQAQTIEQQLTRLRAHLLLEKHRLRASGAVRCHVYAKPLNNLIPHVHIGCDQCINTTLFNRGNGVFCGRRHSRPLAAARGHFLASCPIVHDEDEMPDPPQPVSQPRRRPTETLPEIGLNCSQPVTGSGWDAGCHYRLSEVCAKTTVTRDTQQVRPMAAERSATNAH